MSQSQDRLSDGEHRKQHRSRPHDVQNLYVSLKQWRILHAVIDCGGFAEAARYLHISQSAISYTVSKLQKQLGVRILKAEGRKAALTGAGRALLERSRHVLKEAVELESFAGKLKQGWVAEVRLIVDHQFPARQLMQALRRFATVGQEARVRLHEAAMPRAEESLRHFGADLAISASVPMGYLGEPLIEVEYVPVAHPGHRLFKLGREVTPEDLRQETEISISPSSEPCGGNAGSQLTQRWNMSSVDAAIAALAEGFGYAWLPKHRADPWCDQGLLMRLPLPQGTRHTVMLYLVHARHWAASAAVGKLAEVLRAVVMEPAAQATGVFGERRTTS